MLSGINEVQGSAPALAAIRARTLTLLPAENSASSIGEHERCTLEETGRRLADILDIPCAGTYRETGAYLHPLYFVPQDTLEAKQAAALGIRGEDDLFGGVVPFPFVATKAITHPLVAPDAAAPPGWSHEFDTRISKVVNRGYSAFSLDDAWVAGLRLLGHGPLRLKPAHARGGRSQAVAASAAELDRALAALDEMTAARGIAIEENLLKQRTFSVGIVRLPGIEMAYFGRQRTTRDNEGERVYAGSDIVAVKGGLDALLDLDMVAEIRTAIEQASVYDAAANACFPGLYASRRNYDVIQGLAADGSRRSGVLEQSWRIGGATGAEIAALEAFRADPAARAIEASSYEVYGPCEAPPAGAAIYFIGEDPEVGPLTKYALVRERWPYASV